MAKEKSNSEERERETEAQLFYSGISSLRSSYHGEVHQLLDT
jgi:hypothetical protein